MARLTDDEIRDALVGLPGWELVDDALRKEFRLGGFRSAIDFVNRVADEAEAARHHPDIDIRYARVTLSLSTHDEGGVTERDTRLASAIERVADAAP